MRAKTVQCVYFTASGSTRKIIEAIAKGTGLETKVPIDLSKQETRESFEGELEGELILVGSPVYVGTVPSIALGAFSKLQGEGKWAVPIGVYGTKSADDYVLQLSGLLRRRGFKILGGAEFVAEHSWAHKRAPSGKGRPDYKDLEVAMEFGVKLSEKMRNPSESSIESKQLSKEDGYWEDREKWPENIVKYLVGAPKIDQKKCIDCGKCVEVCPVNAVNRETHVSDKKLCTRCAACTKVCPTGAKTMGYNLLVSVFMKTWGSDRKEPEIYLS